MFTNLRIHENQKGFNVTLKYFNISKRPISMIKEIKNRISNLDEWFEKQGLSKPYNNTLGIYSNSTKEIEVKKGLMGMIFPRLKIFIRTEQKIMKDDFKNIFDYEYLDYFLRTGKYR